MIFKAKDARYDEDGSSFFGSIDCHACYSNEYYKGETKSYTVIGASGFLDNPEKDIGE